MRSHTTPYHPQGDGQFNQALLDMLATISHDCPLDWEDHIYGLQYQCISYYKEEHLSIMFPMMLAADDVTYGDYAVNVL